MLTAALLLLAGGQALSITPPRTPIAAPRPRGLQMRKLPSRTSRVRGWTISQRVCEKETNSACVMSAPDLVQVEADKPRE